MVSLFPLAPQSLRVSSQSFLGAFASPTTCLQIWASVFFSPLLHSARSLIIITHKLSAWSPWHFPCLSSCFSLGLKPRLPDGAILAMDDHTATQLCILLQTLEQIRIAGKESQSRQCLDVAVQHDCVGSCYKLQPNPNLCWLGSGWSSPQGIFSP